MVDKAAFRWSMQERERSIPVFQREESDLLLQRQFLALADVQQAETILLFYSMKNEINTRPILTALQMQGKRVLLPRCLPQHQMEARVYHPKQMKQHPFGMWEPDEDCAVVKKDEIDLILVPALCFDRQGRRMGRGGGFYDRYLAGYAGRTVGLCREALLCDEVPVDPWDRPVELVATEETVYHCGTI